jgi:DNA replication protein DnaC
MMNNLSHVEPYILPPVKPLPPCPICKGAGFTRLDVPVGHPHFGKPQRCHCTLAGRTQAVFERATIPHTLHNCSFESLARLPNTSEQQKAALKIQAFLLEQLHHPSATHKHGLYLWGQLGRGKTGLALSALRIVLAAGKTGGYLPASDLFAALYAAIAASQRLLHGRGTDEDRQEETAGARVLRMVETVECLVLDDLGVECGSRFVLGHLYRLIERRRSTSGFMTIITSNHSADSLTQHWRPESPKAAPFEDTLRIVERIGESFISLPIIGRNLRQH